MLFPFHNLTHRPRGASRRERRFCSGLRILRFAAVAAAAAADVCTTKDRRLLTFLLARFVLPRDMSGLRGFVSSVGVLRTVSFLGSSMSACDLDKI